MLRSPVLGALTTAILLLSGACQPAPDASGTSASAQDGPDARPHVMAGSAVEAGGYLVRVAGCNDCHTAGYLESEGQVPREEWLKGWAVGFRGPWGTTYPNNLRLTVQRLTEDEWVEELRTRRMKPPMPWFNLHEMSERDRRVLYRFIESLGAPGEPVPSNLPPDQEPRTPYIPFTPREPASG